MIGSISEGGLFQQVFAQPEIRQATIEEVLEKPFPMVEFTTPIEKLSSLINKENGAVLAKDEIGSYHIVTKYDLLQAMSK